MNAITIRRKATNVTLDQAVLDEARELGINVSRACQSGLVKAVKAAREKAWLEKNRASLLAWNDWVEKNGLPFAEFRQF